MNLAINAGMALLTALAFAFYGGTFYGMFQVALDVFGVKPLSFSDFLYWCGIVVATFLGGAFCSLGFAGLLLAKGKLAKGDQ